MSAVPCTVELDLVSGIPIPTLAGREPIGYAGYCHQVDFLVGSLSVVLWFDVLGDRMVSACLGFEIGTATPQMKPGTTPTTRPDSYGIG
jgi:hypothetical protein